MGLLTRDQILGASDLPTKEVEVPEWGGSVLVRSITAKDRDEFEQALVQAREAKRFAPENVRARYVAACVVGEDGKPLFTPKDVEALGAKSFAALDRVYQAAISLNALSDGDIEALEKN